MSNFASVSEKEYSLKKYISACHPLMYCGEQYKTICNRLTEKKYFCEKKYSSIKLICFFLRGEDLLNEITVQKAQSTRVKFPISKIFKIIYAH